MKASPLEWDSLLLKEAWGNLILFYQTKPTIERRKPLEDTEFVGIFVLDFLPANACYLKLPKSEALCCSSPDCGYSAM